jgi:branched-chain amino acid transport system ATP-binding protein
MSDDTRLSTDAPAASNESSSPPAEPMLQVRELTAGYGPVTALRGADLEVRPGEVVCVLGVNGAGKSTLLHSISGVVRPAAGRVVMDGRDLAALRPEAVVRRGISLVPEGRQLFTTLSVRDNLLLGAYPLRRDQATVRRTLGEVEELFPVLHDSRDRPGGALSGGEQQMLAIGRALMARPRLLMLDEPSLGLAPKVVRAVMDLIRALAGQDRGVLLVEQLARVALQISHRGYLLESGRIVLQGTSADLQANDRVREIYMGVRG